MCITLDEVMPRVWRRLLVPGSIRLAKLNDVFQVAMGWTNSHLHRFTIGDESFAMLLDDYPEDEADEKEVSVLQAIAEHRRFSYEYDFGDSWGHEVVVEELTRLPHGLKHAVCLDGQNACPPEDCGGVGGYAALLEALADPTHVDHNELMDWVGGTFDPALFGLAAVNAELQRLR
jgi:Plasmid pRiA4b ORF-3-like protein